MGLVALWHVESSQTRDGMYGPCSGRIPNHWTTREVLFFFLRKNIASDMYLGL